HWCLERRLIGAIKFGRTRKPGQWRTRITRPPKIAVHLALAINPRLNIAEGIDRPHCLVILLISSSHGLQSGDITSLSAGLGTTAMVPSGLTRISTPALVASLAIRASDGRLRRFGLPKTTARTGWARGGNLSACRITTPPVISGRVTSRVRP